MSKYVYYAGPLKNPELRSPASNGWAVVAVGRGNDASFLQEHYRYVIGPHRTKRAAQWTCDHNGDPCGASVAKSERLSRERA